MRRFFALISGGMFGIGLLLANTTDTMVIHNWLDIFGPWNPTLGFFFIGSAGIMGLGWWLASGHEKALLANPMPQQVNKRLDSKLIFGSLLFGTGWGLAGICPGPSIAALSFGGSSGMYFFGAMVFGMIFAVPLQKAFPKVNRGNRLTQDKWNMGR